ncbi:MAG: CRTAC1 family protein, partial [Planctomycetota bacterium]
KLQMEAHFGMGQAYVLLGETEQGISHFQTAEGMAKAIRQVNPVELSDAVFTRLDYGHALAAFRKGENENCIHCTDGQGCLFPITQAGIHQKQEGAKLSIEYLQRVLESQPNHAPSIWLLNIAHMTLGTFPEGVPEKYRLNPETWRGVDDFPTFPNVASGKGVDALSNCGGAAVEDFNGDGFLDVVVSDWKDHAPLQLFLGDGKGNFEDATIAANLEHITGGLNLVQADYDNDGDIDLLLLRGAWRFGARGKMLNSLLENNGEGVFVDVTFAVGMAGSASPSGTAAFGDIDADGDLDLYIGNENVANELFINDGKGNFKNVADQRGVADEGYTKGVTWGDIDNDGDLDLYVSNLQGENHLYVNDGRGHFSQQAADRGIDGPHDGFGTWFWDYDNDGDLDLMSLAYQVGVQYMLHEFIDDPGRFGLDKRGERLRLYENNGDGYFTDVAVKRGLKRHNQPMGCNYGDLNNDGFPDFYIGTGFPGLDAVMPNEMYRNDGGGQFSDITIAGGFGHLQKGHGIAFADFDNDGDQDVFAEMGGAYTGDAFNNALFENPGFENAQWIKLPLVGRRSNRKGMHARIRVNVIDQDGSKRTVHHVCGTGGSFGCNPLVPHIGLGNAKSIESVQVQWPCETKLQTVTNVSLGSIHVVMQE